MAATRRYTSTGRKRAVGNTRRRAANQIGTAKSMTRSPTTATVRKRVTSSPKAGVRTRKARVTIPNRVSDTQKRVRASTKGGTTRKRRRTTGGPR